MVNHVTNHHFPNCSTLGNDDDNKFNHIYFAVRCTHTRYIVFRKTIKLVRYFDKIKSVCVSDLGQHLKELRVLIKIEERRRVQEVKLFNLEHVHH